MPFEMTAEQKEMFDSLSTLQQKVAVNVISGMSNIDAYKSAGGKSKTQQSAEASVSRMLSDVKVKAFIDSMKAEAVSSAVMSREEMLERLSGLARTNMSDLITWHVELSTDDEGQPKEQALWAVKESALQDPIAMASISEVTAGKDGFKIKQHSPLQAMKMIADMQGYNAPVKSEQSGTMQVVQMSKEEYADTRQRMLDEDDC